VIAMPKPSIIYVLRRSAPNDPAPRYFRATVGKEHVATLLVRNAARFTSLDLAQKSPAFAAGGWAAVPLP
jgi:hypothetical protein